jgi:hypothetical protein
MNEPMDAPRNEKTTWYSLCSISSREYNKRVHRRLVGQITQLYDRNEVAGKGSKSKNLIEIMLSCSHPLSATLLCL